MRSPPHYGWGLIALHWLTLGLIAAAAFIGWWLDGMPLSPLKLQLYAWHKWLGLLVLSLLPLRLLLRALDPLDQGAELTPWEARLSGVVHGLLYLLMCVVPLVGWLHSSAAGFSVVWFGVLPLPDLVGKDAALAAILRQAHAATVASLLALVALHALAALYHRHVRRDAVLARMLPSRR
ncbi:MAG: cytochrome b/b6 domain-containing protein [Pseudomonadota bacterium]